MIYPKVLLVSNRYDFSTDFIAVELDKQNIEYIRINRDELKDYSIEFNPITPEIIGEHKKYSFKITTKHLKSIYYCSPTFFRDIIQDGLT